MVIIVMRIIKIPIGKIIGGGIYNYNISKGINIKSPIVPIWVWIPIIIRIPIWISIPIWIGITNIIFYIIFGRSCAVFLFRIAVIGSIFRCRSFKVCLSLSIFRNRFFPGIYICLLYTSPSPRDRTRSRMPSSA